jgi:hypothetical protein
MMALSRHYWQRARQSPYLWPLVTAGVALLLYTVTMPPDLTFANYGADGGELITAAVTLGIPHPPGYPTYVLLGRLFAYLPLGTVAFRFNLFSAVGMALAAALVTAVAIHEHKSTSGPTPAAVVAPGLLFAFAPLVWGQAIIAEVYALNTLFLAATLWALLTQRSAWLVGSFMGLSLTTHLTSYLMLPLVLALTRLPEWPKVAGGIGLGLTPLLALPLLARGSSPIIWGNPVTPGQWWWLVSGRLYRENLFSLPLAEWLPRLNHWLRAGLSQFTWLGWPVLAVGLAETWPTQKRRHLFLLATVLGYATWAFGYRTDDAAVFFLPGLLLLSLLLIPGLRWAGAMAFLLPLTLIALNFTDQNLRYETAVRHAAEAILRQTPADALVLTPGDETIFALWYFHHVEGQRPDLIIVDRNLLAFSWYRKNLQRHYPDLVALEIDNLEQFQQANSRLRLLCPVSLTSSRMNCQKDLR